MPERILCRTYDLGGPVVSLACAAAEVNGLVMRDYPTFLAFLCFCNSSTPERRNQVVDLDLSLEPKIDQ